MLRCITYSVRALSFRTQIPLNEVGADILLLRLHYYGVHLKSLKIIISFSIGSQPNFTPIKEVFTVKLITQMDYFKTQE